MAKKHIRFDWAAKKMLRDKKNFDILEGFLSELLKEDIKIEGLLESESNQEEEDEKFNRVDLYAENSLPYTFFSLRPHYRTLFLACG